MNQDRLFGVPYMFLTGVTDQKIKSGASTHDEIYIDDLGPRQQTKQDT